MVRVAMGQYSAGLLEVRAGKISPPPGMARWYCTPRGEIGTGGSSAAGAARPLSAVPIAISSAPARKNPATARRPGDTLPLVHIFIYPHLVMVINRLIGRKTGSKVCSSPGTRGYILTDVFPSIPQTDPTASLDADPSYLSG